MKIVRLGLSERAEEPMKMAMDLVLYTNSGLRLLNNGTSKTGSLFDRCPVSPECRRPWSLLTNEGYYASSFTFPNPSQDMIEESEVLAILCG